MIPVSVIIPVYRDTDALARMLASTDFADADVIVVSTADDTESLAALRAARPDIQWVDAARGRASQMNAGAAVARGSWLLFLHADTQLPRDWRSAIAGAQRGSRVVFGCFRFALDSPRVVARAIELGVRLRVALFDLPYGDQAIFVRRDAFSGFPEIPLMEDVAFSRAMKRAGRPACVRSRVVTSGRRWESRGVLRTIVLMWRLRLLYALGVAPQRLARKYADQR